LPEHDLALLCTAARRAGEIAMRFWKNTPQVWDKGAAGPVTEADLAVNDMLQTTLLAARPGYGWLSEETPDGAARLDCEHVFIIDPIDGTRAFIAGETHFSHSLAVARNGQITAACVYLPALDLIYTATLTGPALRNGQPIRASQTTKAEHATLLTPKANLAPAHWCGAVPPVTRAFRASIAYRLCLIADGSFDGVLSFFPVWEWDSAAGALIASRAGATVTDRHNAPLVFNTTNAQSQGILAASPGLHSHLIARMQR
jgi:myo-inositol-1(or 4)-monophosphatase